MVRMAGHTPSAALLGRIERGEIGGVVLLGSNITTKSALIALTRKLQEAATRWWAAAPAHLGRPGRRLGQAGLVGTAHDDGAPDGPERRRVRRPRRRAAGPAPPSASWASTSTSPRSRTSPLDRVVHVSAGPDLLVRRRSHDPTRGCVRHRARVERRDGDHEALPGDREGHPEHGPRTWRPSTPRGRPSPVTCGPTGGRSSTTSR